MSDFENKTNVSFNLTPPMFPGAPIPPKIGIPLRLYNQYILKCLDSGVTVTEIYSQLKVIGYLHRYVTFAKYVSQEVRIKITDKTGVIQELVRVDKFAVKSDDEIKEFEKQKPIHQNIKSNPSMDDLMQQPAAIAALIKRKKD